MFTHNCRQLDDEPANFPFICACWAWSKVTMTWMASSLAGACHGKHRLRVDMETRNCRFYMIQIYTKGKTWMLGNSNDLFPLCQSLRVTEALVGTQIWFTRNSCPKLAPNTDFAQPSQPHPTLPQLLSAKLPQWCSEPCHISGVGSMRDAINSGRLRPLKIEDYPHFQIPPTVFLIFILIYTSPSMS